jgi:phosphoesterase RecJ-like protein
LDASDRERIGAGLVAAVSRATLVNIDHHNYNTRFGVVNWVDPKASAVGEQIWRFARSLEWTLPPNSLRALYVALITDTGQFSYGNTTPRAMRIAADLVAAGVDPETIWRYVYLEKTTQELALEARARMSLTYWADGRIAVIGVRDRDFAETGTDPQATAEFTNIPRSVVGALMALFFYEIEDGRATKVSIRGVRELNACKLARRFGGGGHPQAAGCTLVKPLAEAMEEFRPAAESAAEALGSAAVLPQKREKHE